MDSAPSPHKFFESLRSSGFSRSESQWLGGVAAGLAGRFRIDTVLVRGIAVALALLGGVGLIAYGLAWAFLPDEKGLIHVEQALQKNWTAGMTGALVSFLLGIGPAPWIFGSITPYLWPLLVIAAVVFIVFSRNNTRYAAGPRRPRSNRPAGSEPAGPPDPGTGHDSAPFTAASAAHNRPFRPSGAIDDDNEEHMMAPDPAAGDHWPHPPSRPPKAPAAPPMPGWVVTIVVGLAVLLMALVFGSDYLGLVDYPGGAWSLALSLGLLFVGLVLVFASLLRRTSGGLLGLAIPLLVFALIFGNTGFGFRNSSGFGTQSGSAIAQTNDGDFNAVFSNATIDLRHYANLSSSTTVDINTAFATVDLLLPGDVPVRVESNGIFLQQVGAQPMSSSGRNGAPVLTVEIDGAFSRFNLEVDTSTVPLSSTEF